MNCLYLLVLALLLVVQTSVTATVTCGPGYVQDKGVCKDEDECEEEEGLCGNNAVCYNTNGSYYCQCEQGYRAKSFNFTVEQGEPCKDINECTDNKSICGPNAVCTNIPGSYHCSCDTGFVTSNKQEHFNASQNVTCDALLLVVQTSVTASVNCAPGQAQDKDGCKDEDECEEEGICGNNAVCYNTNGSYYCQCEQGYRAKLFNFTQEQGEPCKDINECMENNSICGPNAVCSNIPGSYHCSCATGFVASNGQEHFNASQNVTCDETKRSSENITLCVHNTDKSSAREQQLFNPTLLTFLLVSHWILKIYQ